jgi:hypothetical protein
MAAARYIEISATAQSAYAELLESALAADHNRTVSDLGGSFAAKTVKGRRYWYFQYTEPSGQLRQVFVGPDNEAVAALRGRKAVPGSASSRLAPLARSAAALGCREILPLHARVLNRLAEYGFFRAGGLVIGTHAFLACGNMLGVRWGDSDRTQDVDFEHAGRSVSLALPTNLSLDTDEALKSLDMGLLPVRSLTAAGGATYLNPKQPDFRLDFLTTRTRDDEKPFRHPQLGVTMQPLPFMEYSLEDVRQAVLFSGDVVVPVNLPSPARYALHKLIVFGERSGTFAAKSTKDIRQAAALLSRLGEMRRSEVENAWRDLVVRGPGWRRRAKIGLQALGREAPELKEWLDSIPVRAAKRKPRGTRKPKPRRG